MRNVAFIALIASAECAAAARGFSGQLLAPEVRFWPGLATPVPKVVNTAMNV